MKKRIFASLLLSLSMAGGLFAETTQTLLVNGEKVDKVVTSITFDGDNVILHFGTDSESYDMNLVSLGLEYSAGLDDLKVFTFNGKIEGGVMYVSGVNPDSPILVYGLSGMLERSAKADEQGNAAIDIETLPGGVYILRAGNNCVKFVKR